MSQQITHGSLDHAELAALGRRPEQVIDFSSNINPFGPPAPVRQALAALDPAPYPDRGCTVLRQALATRHRCAPEQVLVGNGSNELIHLLARALLRPGDTVLVIEPTFGEYAHAARLAGARVLVWRADERAGWSLEPHALAEAVEQMAPRLVWLCAPNNPTGIDVDPHHLLTLAKICSAVGGMLVVDRAYAAFLRGAPLDRDPLDSEATGLLRVYSLTKCYALAGLRLGYVIAGPELVERLAEYQPAWSVNSAAQAAGLAALADEAFLPTTLPALWQASDRLLAGVQALGLAVWRAALPFLLVRTGDAAATRAALLRNGCVVRDCASFGLRAWVRVAPQRPAENERLLQAWATIR